MDVKNLLILADQALTGEGSPDEQIDKIEAFSSAFANWYEENAASLSETTDQESLKVAQQVQAKHAEVIEKIRRMHSMTSAGMSKFREKAKGIMAYADDLPKRISIASKRQG